MFHNMPDSILKRMQELEQIDAKDREDGTSQLKRLRQVSPEAGKFLAILAAESPKDGVFLEVGTSAGYSALWISRAMRTRGGCLITFELLPDKVALAHETFKKAKVESFVELVHGDARGHIGLYTEVSFCFVDCEKEMYDEVYDRVAPNLVSGGLLIVDNVVSHAEELKDFVAKAEADESVDAVVIPIGKGLLVCRKV